MKKILWLSRHQMTDEQIADLHRIYGDNAVVKQYAETVKNWRQIVEIGKDCDIFAVVLPPAMLTDLVNPRNNVKPVIRAIANRVPTGNMIKNPATGKEEKEFRFEHAGWEQVLKIEILTKKL